MLRISVRRLDTLVHDRYSRIPFRREGRRILFPARRLEEWNLERMEPTKIRA